MPETAVLERSATAFALSTPSGGALVTLPPPPALTLARMQNAVDALESAESRAVEALRQATQHLGKNASNRWTRFVDGKWLWPAAIGGGVVAAVATYYLVGPDAASYVQRNEWDNTYYHKVTGHRWGPQVALALAGSLLAGLVSCTGFIWGSRRASRAMKVGFARGQLDSRQLADLERAHKGAAERLLERATIGKVARDAIPNLAARQIYVSDEAEAILKAAADDADLGDADARAEADRHRSFIKAVRELESGKAEVKAHVDRISAAFAALTSSERAAVASDLRERLFDGKVPRRKDIPYPLAQALYQNLTP